MDKDTHLLAGHAIIIKSRVNIRNGEFFGIDIRWRCVIVLQASIRSAVTLGGARRILYLVLAADFTARLISFAVTSRPQP